MTSSFLGAARRRTSDAQLSAKYRASAAKMDPLVRDVLVDNIDPASVDVDELLSALQQDGSRHDWASKLQNSIRSVAAVLSAAQCGVLRDAVDAAPMEILDSVDGLLEFQLNLDSGKLAELLGQDTLDRLNRLAARTHGEFCTPYSAAACCAASSAGIDLNATALSAPHEVFVRRYSSTTRPWFGFHHDRSSLTLNIALSDDEDHVGGKLLAILEGRLHSCERSAGTATLHASTLLHAVTRMVGVGTRYSLILFYRQICPHAGHTLVRCDAATMELLYPLGEGSYSCDECGDSASDLEGCGTWWHCSQGCEYDVCSPCHSVGLADGIDYVSVR